MSCSCHSCSLMSLRVATGADVINDLSPLNLSLVTYQSAHLLGSVLYSKYIYRTKESVALDSILGMFHVNTIARVCCGRHSHLLFKNQFQLPKVQNSNFEKPCTGPPSTSVQNRLTCFFPFMAFLVFIKTCSSN